MQELKYPMFDGERVWESACVNVENGIITSVKECDSENCDSNYFLMPGLIGAHTHMCSNAQVKALLEHGVLATCDVSASEELISNSKEVKIINSGGMAMGIIVSGKAFVEKAVANGAKYIKVLLFNALSIGKPALCRIVKEAHKKGLKVAVHATEIATVKQAVDAGADILLHVPMQEPFPVSLAKKIAEKGIVVAPTLTMMETFAQSGRNRYKLSDYENAKAVVKLLKESRVTILAATDANIGSFAPAVSYGDSMHREMELLFEAGRASAGNEFLDDKRYISVLEVAEACNLPIYVHPAAPHKAVQKVYYGGFEDLLSARLSLHGWRWHNEAGIQVLRMILAGRLEQFPNLQLIAGHWGEMVPFFLSRLDQSMPQSVTKLNRSITETFKENVYVTPSGIFDYPQLKFCVEVLGANRIIHSVDCPFISNEGAKPFIDNAPISDKDKELIAYRNAERLFGW